MYLEPNPRAETNVSESAQVGLKILLALVLCPINTFKPFLHHIERVCLSSKHPDVAPKVERWFAEPPVVCSNHTIRYIWRSSTRESGGLMRRWVLVQIQLAVLRHPRRPDMV